MTRKITIPQTSWVIGDGQLSLVVGPCSIESPELLRQMADFLPTLSVQAFRGGIHKLRTQPQSFQGLGEEILDELKNFKLRTQLPVVAEITDVRNLELYAETVDVYQVGSRNMYNYPLLSELGKLKKPVLLKRAFSATLTEWLAAASYLEQQGNSNIILCERGIRTFDTTLRNTLDLGAVAYLKAETDYPVFVDPSHACGRRDLVPALSLAAKAAGADGLLIEVHPLPDQALSDGQQSIDFRTLQKLIQDLATVTRYQAF